MKKRELFKVEGEQIVRLRRHCPKCGDGVFLAEHKNRMSCGKCGYTEFKGTIPVPPTEIQPSQAEKPSEPSVEEKKEEPPAADHKEETSDKPKDDVPPSNPPK